MNKGHIASWILVALVVATTGAILMHEIEYRSVAGNSESNSIEDRLADRASSRHQLSAGLPSIQPSSIAAVELPREYVDTTYTPGSCTINVSSGGNLQTALDNAQYGDTVCIEAGATFTGNFKLRPKSGSTGWIVVRSSQYNQLPSEGNRVSPSHASLMPKLVSPNNQPAIEAVNGADRYRLIGLEVTIDSSQKNLYGATLVAAGNAANSIADLPEDFIVDRCYIHGFADAATRRGVSLQAVRGAVVDSYISEIHEYGTDSQAVAAWKTTGPLKVNNNYLEASAENFVVGGAATFGTVVPSDIEVRGNYLFKPLSWKEGDPSYAGRRWMVKNLIEFKTGIRVLVEGNMMENNWPANQPGFSVVLTVRNQIGNQPHNAVQDLTFRNNVIKNGYAGVTMLAYDTNGTSQQLKDIAIYNNLFEDANNNGRAFQIIVNKEQGPTDSIFIENNTIPNALGALLVATARSGSASMQNDNFTYKNNIVDFGSEGLFGQGTGSSASFWTTYFTPNYVLSGNVLLNAPNWYSFPNNLNYKSPFNSVGFVNAANGDYSLSANSPYKNAAVGGGDPGANIPQLRSLTTKAISGNWGSGGSTPPPPPPSDTTPPSISNISVSNVTSTNALVTWSTNESATTQVQYGTSNSLGLASTVNNNLLTSHSVLLTGLTPNTTYYYRVLSSDGSGNQSVSAISTFTTDVAPDITGPVISGVTARNITDTSATLAWTTDEAATSQAAYGPSTPLAYTTTLNSALVTSHTQTLSGLTPNTTYYYRVRSLDTVGNQTTSSLQSFATGATPDTTAPTISSLTAGNITDTGARITWTTDEAATSQVAYGSSSSLGSVTSKSNNLVTSHGQTLSNLTPNTTYYYRAISIDQALNQRSSVIQSFTTTGSSSDGGDGGDGGSGDGGDGNQVETNIDVRLRSVKQGVSGVAYTFNSLNVEIDREEFVTGPGGRFRITLDGDVPRYVKLRVKADGYLSSTLTIDTDSGETYTFVLKPGDIDGDGVISTLDSDNFVRKWRNKDIESSDWNGDGLVNSLDYSEFSENWNETDA